NKQFIQFYDSCDKGFSSDFDTNLLTSSTEKLNRELLMCDVWLLHSLISKGSILQIGCVIPQTWQALCTYCIERGIQSYLKNLLVLLESFNVHIFDLWMYCLLKWMIPESGTIHNFPISIDMS